MGEYRLLFIYLFIYFFIFFFWGGRAAIRQNLKISWHSECDSYSYPSSAKLYEEIACKLWHMLKFKFQHGKILKS